MSLENGLPMFHENLLSCEEEHFYVDEDDPGLFIFEYPTIKVDMGGKKAGDQVGMIMIDTGNSILEMYNAVTTEDGECEPDAEPFATVNIKLVVAD